MAHRFNARLTAVEAKHAPREPLHITITHYLGEDAEPVRQQYGLPHNLKDWPDAVLAQLTPLSVREFVV